VPLDEVVQVDDMVRGCPMNARSFLQTLQKYLQLYEVA
jgi:coenzyme F420-reducing hydrogenase gamma subunit